jgi:hypothetical protein
MLFSNNRDELRRFYIDSWHKFQNREPLQPLEAMVAEVIAQHPEYHAMLETGDNALERDFLPDEGQSNPFLHMGMHLAIREQLSTNRPSGIAQLHAELLKRADDPHEVEHHMLECLGEAMWKAQRSGTPPDEARYLECLKKIR